MMRKSTPDPKWFVAKMVCIPNWQAFKLDTCRLSRDKWVTGNWEFPLRPAKAIYRESRLNEAARAADASREVVERWLPVS
jgi:hypothetical protein